MSAPRPSDNSPASTPRVSVVITAWNRRRFLRSAVATVLASDLRPPEVELLVVKNFLDPELDGDLARLGVRTLLDVDAPVGASVARGLEEARGEVVCFLDDDDEFEPAKLPRILALFESDPALTLVRNGYRPIDADGQALPTWPICEWPGVAPPAAVTLRTPADKRRSRVLPMYNLSTISVRRRALLPFVPRFRTIAAGSDSLVFLAGLATAGAVRVDPAVLSRHRVHESVSMEMFSGRGIAPPPNPEYLERSLEALRRQEAMVGGTPAESWAHWLYVITRLDAYLSRPEFPPPSLREYFEFFRGAVRERQRFRFPPLGFAVARRALPTWAYEQWWSFRQRQHRADVGALDMAEVFARAGER